MVAIDLIVQHVHSQLEEVSSSSKLYIRGRRHLVLEHWHRNRQTAKCDSNKPPIRGIKTVLLF